MSRGVLNVGSSLAKLAVELRARAGTTTGLHDRLGVGAIAAGTIGTPGTRTVCGADA